MSDEAARQLVLGLHLPSQAGFADYWPGPNAEPLFHVRRFAQGAGPQLLYLWGAAGTGKTHLLHAACNAAAARRVGYLPLQEAAQFGPAILDDLDALDCLCIDDLQRVAGDAAWEHALFNCLVRARERERRVLIAAEPSPALLAVQRDDLLSRVRAGLACHLERIDDVRLAEALAFLCARRGMDIAPAVVDFLLKRVARDLPGLIEVVDRLDAASLQAQRRLTVPFVRAVLAQHRRLPGREYGDD
jgi:DnaA family protein